MNALKRILRFEDEHANLDEAAFQIARIEYPTLVVPEWLAELDRHAEEMRRRMGGSFRLTAQQYLFGELGIAGNEADYYNPRNSCLNHVLEARTGIPITICVLYMELGRRLGVAVDGIGAPGHFLLRLEEDGDTYYLDPYHQGQIKEDVERELDPRYLVAASKRSIVIRMLNNLRLIYLQRQAWRKANAVLDLLLEADPVDADVLRQRAATLAATQRFHAAAADLDRYLELRPLDPDGEELKNQIARLHRMHAHKN
ncbi:SirB1 family protein [Bryobacter aggregatus]|uniref:SirB1 family protein n=1 Tax=Bryobacter aggregatus TaxID=360054 RepID=UPI0004E1A820|nr:transglutaminase-like domain-containing protein [Bryobacter aggregatus]